MPASTVTTLLLLSLLLSVTTAQSANNNQCNARPAAADSIFKTTRLTPMRYNVTLGSLPKPYATNSASKFPETINIPKNATLQVPGNFSVNTFASGLVSPRWLALTPTGDILVTQTDRNNILILADTNGDGVADVNRVFANASSNSLNRPFGMVFTRGSLYIANTNEIRRYNYTNGSRVLSGSGVRIANLSGGGNHWTRNLVLSQDGSQLYVSIGSAANVEVEASNRATIWSMNLDGSNQQVFGSGIRNPVGLSINPATGELYTVVNERDGLGDGLVPDYFTRVRKGEFFGWPYAYLSPKNLDPRLLNKNGASANPARAAQTRTPDVLFEAHSAPLGLKFYTGNTFPDYYKRGAFAALHGSWNRNRGTGYKVVFIPFGSDNRPNGTYSDFLTGFLYDASVPSAWGRPTGLLVLNDGSLLVTDDANGRIYRVQYQC